MLETLGYIPVKTASPHRENFFVQVLFEKEPLNKRQTIFILRYYELDVCFDYAQVRQLLNLSLARVSGSVYFDFDASFRAGAELYYSAEYHTFTYSDHISGQTRYQFMLEDASEAQLVRYLLCAVGERVPLELIRDSLQMEVDVIESFLNDKEN